MAGNQPSGGQRWGDVRASDAEREQIVTQLGKHYVDGRLTHEEHEERSSQAYEARTRAELARLVNDLPAPSRKPSVPAGPATAKDEHGSHRNRPPFALIAVIAFFAIPILGGLFDALEEGFLPILLVIGAVWFFTHRARSGKGPRC